MFGIPNSALEFLVKIGYNSSTRSLPFNQLFAFQNGRVFQIWIFGEDGLEMDVAKMLADLRQEREQIEEAILSLERLARNRGKRRGRPPQWMQEVKKRGRPPGSKNKPKADGKAPSGKPPMALAG